MALTTLDEVLLLGSAPVDEVATAKRTFAGIRALPFLERLSAATVDPLATTPNS